MNDIPAWWAEVELGELGVWVGGNTPDKANPAYWQGGTVPWASPKDIKADVVEGTEDRLTETALDQGKATLLPAGSVLVVTRSGILRHSVPSAVSGVDLAINQDIKALIPAPGVEAAFVAEQLRALQTDVLKAASKAGATVESLDLARLMAFKVRLAPTGEQVRIVERLRQIRAFLSRSRSEVKRLSGLVATMRGTMTERELSGQNVADADGMSALPSIPTRLADITAIPVRNGLSVRGTREPPGVRALRLSALRSAVVDVNDVRYLPIGREEADRFSLEPGDVLVSRGNGSRALVGLASLVPALDEMTIFPDTAFRVRLDQDRVVPEWFVAAWNAPTLRTKLAEMARTTAGIWKIAQRDLATVTLAVPPVEVQLEAVERLRAVNARLDRVLELRGRIESLLLRTEQAVATWAFDGRLVPRVTGEGLAVDLLEAIKSAPEPIRPRRLKPTMPIKTTRERLDVLLQDWPVRGHSFEQLRHAVSAPYEDIKTAVYDMLKSGQIAQRFDRDQGVMYLVRPQ